MSLPLFLQGLGSIGVFASRAFLPAFATALLLRFGPHAPALARYGLLPPVRDVPTWFTSDPALLLLGLLAILELLAERVPEAKLLLDRAHDALKTGMAVLTYLGTLSATEKAAVGQVIRQAGLFDFLPALAVGAAVYTACRARSAILAPLADADEDDDLGLQGLLRWLEDLWGGLGPLALLLLPLLTLAAFGVALLALVLAERWVETRGEAVRAPCPSCGRPLHPSAPSCPSCHAPVKGPRAVGLLGQPKASPAGPVALPFQLVAAKRCPACATRFTRRAVKQSCEACGDRRLDDPRFALAYVRFIDRRLPTALAACFVLGLVPVLGVIPGVIAYRLTVVAPYRRYLPPTWGFLLRWGVRLAVVLLAAVQWVPLAGGLALPAMALVNYAAYRTAYRRLALGPSSDL